MIILDTNVVSEFARKLPNPIVVDWLAGHDQNNVFLTVISIMEIYRGAWSLPTGKKRAELERKIEFQCSTYFVDRILGFDFESSRICAELMVKGKSGTPFAKVSDYQIAAIAKRHGFAVATRNVKDFQHEDLRVINPWADQP
jgi:toxin FitB